MITYAGQDTDQEEHSSFVGENANLYNYFGNQYGSFSENWKLTYLKTKQYLSRAYIQWMLNHTTWNLFFFFICVTL